MKTLQEYFQEADTRQVAIGHFNFSTADQLKAIAEAAAELNLPVMVGTSEGEAEFVGRKQAVVLVQSYREAGIPIFLNADHHKSWQTAQEAIDSGYDTVLIDASVLPYEENLALTKRVVEYGRSHMPGFQIEGELGYLKGSSEIQTKVEISEADYTQPQQAADFVARTGVDRLAIAIGNIHGIVTDQEERLDIERLKAIHSAVPQVYLVLHGASGLPDQDIRTAIECGIRNVHINTELRVGYHDALAKELQSEPGQTTPYKFLAPSYETTKVLVLEKLRLFTNL